ncbi:MAG: AIR synthase-related protein [Clostridium sp.]
MMSSVKPLEGREGMRVGQDLVVAGYIGLGGTIAVAKAEETELLKHFTRQFVKRVQGMSDQIQMPSAEFFKEAGAMEYEPLGDGGIMASLWNLFEEYKMGFEIELRSIPILQETVEICEVFDLNPYRLQSAQSVLLTADHGGDLVRYLNQHGVHGVVIGKVEAGIKRQILNGEIRSFLDRPKPDELYKIKLTGGSDERENFSSY